MITRRIDFYDTFQRRLGAIEPLSSFCSRNLFLDLRRWEVLDGWRLAPTFLLVLGEDQEMAYELWIDDFRLYDLKKLFVSFFSKTKEILKENQIEIVSVWQAFVIQDAEKRLFLMVGRNIFNQEERYYSQDKLINLKQKYALKEIRWNDIYPEKVASEKESILITFIKWDIVDELRRNLLLLGVAERHGMDDDMFESYKIKIESVIRERGTEKGIDYDGIANQLIHYDDVSSVAG